MIASPRTATLPPVAIRRAAILAVAATLAIVAAGVAPSGRTAPTSPVATAPAGIALPADTVDDPRPELNPRRLERAIHRRVNTVRAERGLQRLNWADSLHELAHRHSRDMARRDFFAHDNPNGEDVNDRATDLGVVCYRALDDTTFAKGFGENLYKAHMYEKYEERYRNGELVERIYRWYTFEEMADAVVTGWMNSPGHRENLLTRSYSEESIGVYIQDSEYFVTQVFC